MRRVRVWPGLCVPWASPFASRPGTIRPFLKGFFADGPTQGTRFSLRLNSSSRSAAIGPGLQWHFCRSAWAARKSMRVSTTAGASAAARSHACKSDSGQTLRRDVQARAAVAWHGRRGRGQVAFAPTSRRVPVEVYFCRAGKCPSTRLLCVSAMPEVSCIVRAGPFRPRC